MNIITQEAKNKQAIVEQALKKGKSKTARKYNVALSSLKRWCSRYDGTWQSLLPKSRRPHHHPKQHTEAEERMISEAFWKLYERYGWDGVYTEIKKQGYKRSYSGMIYAAKRLGLPEEEKKKKPTRKTIRRYPELQKPGEKVQIDVKEVPYNCLRGEALRDNKRFYQWTAVDECSRVRFMYAFEDHTAQNTVKFFKMVKKAFPFKIQKIQTDNGAEFTNRFLNTEKEHPFDQILNAQGIEHILIPPRTPWHNGKVERSHRNDQRYFYDWETFRNLDELNQKMSIHLEWSNNKCMRTLAGQSPNEILQQKMNSRST